MIFKVAWNGYITKKLMSMHKKFIIIIGGGVKINISSRNTNTIKILKNTDILNISIVSKILTKTLEISF